MYLYQLCFFLFPLSFFFFPPFLFSIFLNTFFINIKKTLLFSFTTVKVYTQSISKAHLLNVAKMWLYKYDYAFYSQNSITAMDTRLASFFDILFCILDNYKFPAYLYSSLYLPTLDFSWSTTPSFSTSYTHTPTPVPIHALAN